MQILILDDDDMILGLVGEVIREYLEEIKETAEVYLFQHDINAVKHIVEHADRIAIVIQDSNRCVDSDLWAEWGKHRLVTRESFPLRCTGGDFYYYFLDCFVPEAGCMFNVGYFSETEYAFMRTWCEKDPRIRFTLKPSPNEFMHNYVREQLSRWQKRTEPTAISNEGRLLAPVAEELAAICGSSDRYLEKMTPRMFEEVVQAVLKNQGFRTELTSTTRDGGYDILAVSGTGLDKEVTLVEVKKWNPDRGVPVGVIRQLYGTMSLNDADHGMLVTTSYVTRDAKREFSRAIPLKLKIVEREKVIEWCRAYRDDVLGIGGMPSGES